MIAILSATENDLYAFPIPIVVWSWYKLGVRSIVFTPSTVGGKLELAKKYCGSMAEFYTFNCEERKEATFSQVSRLFGATVSWIPDSEILVTGDADLAVFGNSFEQFKDSEVRIIGADLLSPEMNQYPMCFIGMPKRKWKKIFCIEGKSLQNALDDTVGKLESISFRGDFWGYDQWYANKMISESEETIFTNSRAKMPERFATNRCDRDDIFWEERLNHDILDAHLWRPGYTDENFPKILKLLSFMYPEENFDWLIEYNIKYKELL